MKRIFVITIVLLLFATACTSGVQEEVVSTVEIVVGEETTLDTQTTTVRTNGTTSAKTTVATTAKTHLPVAKTSKSATTRKTAMKNDYKLYVQGELLAEGKYMIFADKEPKVLVPLVPILQAYDIKVTWGTDTKATITNGKKTFVLDTKKATFVTKGGTYNYLKQTSDHKNYKNADPYFLVDAETLHSITSALGISYVYLRSDKHEVNVRRRVAGPKINTLADTEKLQVYNFQLYDKRYIYAIEIGTEKELNYISFFKDRTVADNLNEVSLIENRKIQSLLNLPFDKVKEEFGEPHGDIGQSAYVPAYITKDAYLIYFKLRDNVVVEVVKRDVLTYKIVERVRV